jgi:DNA-binding response OmpR family regulator
MPRILACAADESAAAELRQVLEAADPGARVFVLGAGEPAAADGYDLVVLHVDRHEQDVLRYCLSLHDQPEGCPAATIVVGNLSAAGRVAALENGADACLVHPFTGAELLAQMRACLRAKERYDRLSGQSDEVSRVNRQLQESHQRVTTELELARRIQMSLLPQALPDLPGMRFAVQYRPCGRVGGDFYDAFRLDEQHVGFYVADAMGHGVPASLLTMFLKKAVRAKDIFGDHYRLVPPDEVLQRLNADLIEQRLADTPFITMVYALFDREERVLRFARAGHPYPLYVPIDGPVHSLEVPGSLLGIFETRFAVATRPMQPGDKMLFYTDGMDSVSVGDREPGTPSLVSCAERYRALAVGPFVDHLARELTPAGELADDFTLLGLEVIE